MDNRIVITKYDEKIIIVFIKKGKAIKIRALDNVRQYSQTVCLGRVESVKNNIDSCFVKYGNNTGFLKGSKYKPESVIPVMLKKETDFNKKDEVTDSVIVSGVYVVVSDSFKGISYSSRITKEERNTIQTDEMNNVIIRKNAVSADTESVINEYKHLSNVLDNINSIKDKRTDNSVLYNGIPSIIESIFSENVTEYDEVLTDIDEVYDLLVDFITKYNSIGINLNLNVSKYMDDMVSLSTLISLSSKIDDAINRKVYLKSDAYLTIDKTEALTVIDVNSGNTVFKGDKASVIHSINIEAANEVAVQLKLRNISGIIIVDFINEYNNAFNEELVKTLKEALKDDDCNAKCHGITKLGLVEISRKRKYKSLKEQLWK